MNPSEVTFGVSMLLLDKLGRIHSERVANRSLPPMEADDFGRADQSTKKYSKETTPLPEGFQPGENDVICGRGRNIWNSVGNTRFRKVVDGRVEEYKSAPTKLDKSAILSSIVKQIRQGSPNGGFVRKENKTGLWVEVGDFLAREKVSQAFRDLLHDDYRSSNKTKRKRRVEEQEKTAEINSELQRQALEQLQSGQTDKNLYEIICQQQSMLQESKRQRASPKIREDHIDSGFVSQMKSETARLSDMNTAASRAEHDNFRPIALEMVQDNTGRALGSSERRIGDSSVQERLQAQSFDAAPFARQNTRPQEMVHPGASFGLGQGMGGEMKFPNDSDYVQENDEDDISIRRMLDSLVAALAPGDHGERHDDPFEPVPLPPDDIIKDIDRIFDY